MSYTTQAQTSIYSSEKDAADEFLAFTLGGEEYGINILRVQEIRGYEPTPGSPTRQPLSRASSICAGK